MSAAPKYSLPEIERRWLVDRDAVSSLEGLPSRRIDDRYLHGTRLRLRKMTAADGAIDYKLCKKYGKSSHLTEPITNLYLTASEHDALATLPAASLFKTRYTIAGGSLDLFDDGLAIFEKEFASEVEASAYTPPPFVLHEITGDPAYSGAALARTL